MLLTLNTSRARNFHSDNDEFTAMQFSQQIMSYTDNVLGLCQYFIFVQLSRTGLKVATNYGNRATGIGTKHAVSRSRPVLGLETKARFLFQMTWNLGLQVSRPGPSGLETWTKWTRVSRPLCRDHNTENCSSESLITSTTLRMGMYEPLLYQGMHDIKRPHKLLLTNVLGLCQYFIFVQLSRTGLEVATNYGNRATGVATKHAVSRCSAALYISLQHH